MELRTPKPSCQRAGFTFIEILVSVTLLLVLSGLLIAGYSRFNDKQTVTQAALTLKSNLGAARTRAASGIKPEGCDTLVGYRVEFPTTNTYTATALCEAQGVQEEVGIKETYTLPPGVMFTLLPQMFLFLPLDRGASVAQVIEISANTNTARLSVLSSGIVDEVP